MRSERKEDRFVLVFVGSGLAYAKKSGVQPSKREGGKEQRDAGVFQVDGIVCLAHLGMAVVIRSLGEEYEKCSPFLSGLRRG